jgi:hypothetical protein
VRNSYRRRDSNVMPARLGGNRFATVVKVAALDIVKATDAPGALIIVNGGMLCVMMVFSVRLELTGRARRADAERRQHCLRL